MDIINKDKLVVKQSGGFERFQIYEIDDKKLNNVINTILKNQDKDLLNELIDFLLKERIGMSSYLRNLSKMFNEDLKIERTGE